MKQKYTHYTEEQLARARSVDLAALLASRGETLKRAGKEYEWMDGSEKVSIRGSLWYHQYERVGGDAVDFAMRFFHKSFPEAVALLIGEEPLPAPEPRPAAPAAEPQAFALPGRNGDMRRVFAYLTGRGISEDVLRDFADRGMLYESAPYHNAVFVGFDAAGEPRHAHMRGASPGSDYKRNAAGSRPEHSFHHAGTNDRLYLFEAPIDMLSYITLHPENWRESSYAAACSVSDRVLFQMLADHPQLRSVFLCLDNDAPGREATARIAARLGEKGIRCEVLVPERKDWNEDLQAKTGPA